MQTRRNFIGNVATGLAGRFATGRVLGANDRIRIGVIGVGDRGTQLAREAMACPDTELAAFADIYTRRLEDAAETRARREDLRRLPPAARRSLPRCRPHRHPAAPARRVFHRRHGRRQARLPGKGHGVHASSRRSHARRVTQRTAGNRVVQIGHQPCSSARSRTPRTTSPAAPSARSPRSAPTCTATPRTASRTGRARFIPT